MKFISLVGNRYGRLVVTGVSHKVNGIYHWKCDCDCGKTHAVARNALQQGNTNSCGCFAIEQRKMANTTHGMSKTKTYAVWGTLLQRVDNPEHKNAKYYYDKGITVCDEWRTFENFYADMGKQPAGLWIERVDNNGPYCKSNCKWETPSRQCSNRGNSGNKSGRIGVYFERGVNKWRACIKVNKVNVDCGRFADFSLACEAMEQAEMKHLGYSRAEGFLANEEK